jgi:hypothetical protein
VASNDKVRELQDLWKVLFPASITVPDCQWGIWLLRYGEATIRDGIARTAIKFQKLNGNMDAEYVGKYASSVMRQLQARNRNAA